MRSIALMNQKGGVGKTTTTVNLAAAIARTGKRTLLIDLDPQAHATLHLGIDPRTVGAEDQPPGVYDLLLDDTIDPMEAARQVGEKTDQGGLWIIPSETDLAAAEGELHAMQGRYRRLSQQLAKVTDKFDYVLLDCPPSLGSLTLNALAACREVLIPMQAHFLALQGVSKLLDTVRLVNEKLNDKLRVAGVVLCMHDANTMHTREVVTDLESFFEAARGGDTPWKFARVLRPAIRRNIKLAECPSFGQTIFEYAPTAAGAEDYIALAENLTKGWEQMLAERESREKGEAPIVQIPDHAKDQADKPVHDPSGAA